MISTRYDSVYPGPFGHGKRRTEAGKVRTVGAAGGKCSRRPSKTQGPGRLLQTRSHIAVDIPTEFIV